MNAHHESTRLPAYVADTGGKSAYAKDGKSAYAKDGKSAYAKDGKSAYAKELFRNNSRVS